METASSGNSESRFEIEKEQILFSSGGVGCGFSSGFLPQPAKSKDVSININNKASETIFFLFNILYFYLLLIITLQTVLILSIYSRHRACKTVP